MPYRSDAQRRFFNANRASLEAQGVDVGEWNNSSRGLTLPKRIGKGTRKTTKRADEQHTQTTQGVMAMPHFPATLLSPTLIARHLLRDAFTASPTDRARHLLKDALAQPLPQLQSASTSLIDLDDLPSVREEQAQATLKLAKFTGDTLRKLRQLNCLIPGQSHSVKDASWDEVLQAFNDRLTHHGFPTPGRANQAPGHPAHGPTLASLPSPLAGSDQGGAHNLKAGNALTIPGTPPGLGQMPGSMQPSVQANVAATQPTTGLDAQSAPGQPTPGGTGLDATTPGTNLVGPDGTRNSPSTNPIGMFSGIGAQPGMGSTMGNAAFGVKNDPMAPPMKLAELIEKTAKNDYGLMIRRMRLRRGEDPDTGKVVGEEGLAALEARYPELLDKKASDCGPYGVCCPQCGEPASGRHRGMSPGCMTWCPNGHEWPNGSSINKRAVDQSTALFPVSGALVRAVERTTALFLKRGAMAPVQPQAAGAVGKAERNRRMIQTEQAIASGQMQPPAAPPSVPMPPMPTAPQMPPSPAQPQAAQPPMPPMPPQPPGMVDPMAQAGAKMAAEISGVPASGATAGGGGAGGLSGGLGAAKPPTPGSAALPTPMAAPAAPPAPTAQPAVPAKPQLNRFGQPIRAKAPVTPGGVAPPPVTADPNLAWHQQPKGAPRIFTDTTGNRWDMSSVTNTAHAWPKVYENELNAIGKNPTAARRYTKDIFRYVDPTPSPGAAPAVPEAAVPPAAAAVTPAA